jgi:tetratricopeptide (TPR) repeat protein/predicted Ser/Thr protein kinase
LAEVTGLPPEKRAAFLQEKRLNADVQRRIEALLALEDHARQMIGNAAAEFLDDADSMEPPFSGTERFEVQRRLGSGGFGVVHLVKDKNRRNAIVALKTLSRTGPESLDRFKREFRQLAEIAHRNLVRLYQLLSEDDRWFFTMEFVDGVDFVSYAGADGRLRGALPQLAAGVCALHACGKIHRDLKPQNVLVSREGRVVILDFGLATDVSAAESRGHGTPAFMSPEQAIAAPLSPATDWYSVGVILYRCLTGRLPPSARQRQAPAPVSRLRPDAPADLSALCTDLLQRDPWLRPSDEEILRRLGAHAEIPTRRQTWTEAPPLMGRESHLEALRGALRQATDGRATTVRIHGVSGIGKSALAHRFLDEVRESGKCLVLEGRCYESELIPYKTLDGLVDNVNRHLRGIPAATRTRLLPRDFPALTRIFPVLKDLDGVEGKTANTVEAANGPGLRARAFQAFRELIANLAASPVVLLIDDLQWGDAEAAGVLLDLLSSPEPLPILFLLAYRSDEMRSSPALKALRARPAANEIELPLKELDEASARDLAVELLGRDGAESAEEIVARIVKASSGNPFFLSELVRHSHDEPWTETKAGTALLDNLLRRRVSGLPAATRRLLQVVAVAGQPIPVTTAENAAEAGGYAEVAQLRAERLVRMRFSGDSEEIEAYHDRIRESIERSLAPETSRQCHRELAFAAESSGRVHPRFLAVHFRGAGLNEPAFSYAMRAADDAETVLAYEDAEEAYRMAIQLAPEDSDRMRAQLKLSVALYNTGRPDEGCRFYYRAAALAERGLLERATFDQIVNYELSFIERAMFAQWRDYVPDPDYGMDDGEEFT